MGLINQLGKFSSQLLRELLRSRNAWHWGPDQEVSFEAIKQEMVKPWRCMTLKLKQRCPQTHHHIDWEQSSCSPMEMIGEQLTIQHREKIRPDRKGGSSVYLGM